MDQNDHRRIATLSATLSRRAAIRGIGGAGVATALGVATAARTGAAQDTIGVAPIEPDAGFWKTWVMESGYQLRLPTPDAAATADDLTELESLAEKRNAAALASVAYWDAGAPGYRWNQLAVQHLQGNGIGGARAARAMALLNVAIYDATVAAWDTKYTHRRPRPAQARPALATLLPTPASPAYPSEHAVTAGAASMLLGHLFPDAAADLAALATEAGQSRLLAGTDYPSDVTAGLELGRQVAELVIARAETDGSDETWTGTVPDEPGMWNGEKPVEPLAGSWQTWVIASGDEFRPSPPPAHDSEKMASDLAELKKFERTNLTNITASYWEYYGGRAFFELFMNQMSQKLFEHRLDANPPRAARAYALMNVAFHDNFVATWDAKYAYWSIRPFQLDPTVTPVFTTPNHPSYPAAHASLAGAMETILGELFPSDAAYFEQMAEAESWSRLWAGIHFRSDIEAGRDLGHSVAQSVVDYARTDGAD